jgi:plasmid stabilization system protein ParE
MIPVDLLPAARVDYDESFDWYAERSAAAARQFSLAVDDSLRLIGENPKLFASIDSSHRACLVRRFPYRIVYRIEPARAVVVAVAHARRRPRYWKDRR